MGLKYIVGTVTSFIALAVAAFGCSAEVGSTSPGSDQAGQEKTGSTTSALSSGDQVTAVAVWFFTGGDDKRSDSEVTFRLNINGTVSQYNTDGQGNEWNNNTWAGPFYAQLPVNTTFGSIRDIGVELWEHDGFIQTDDNWNLQELYIEVELTDGSLSFVASPGGNPLVRLTGSAPTWHWGQF